jgi:AcrR family transcriptional regulator
VLAESGWDELNLERVAEAAGLSRVTLWRQGVRRETLAGALLGRLATDYRDSMWTVLTAPGSGRERLEQALQTLCAIADRHLELLLASDSAFHRAWSESRPRVNFLDPFVRLIDEGTSDGTLRTLGKPIDVADILFNTVCWTYVHMRGRHEWSAPDAADRVVGLVLGGIATDREVTGRPRGHPRR